MIKKFIKLIINLVLIIIAIYYLYPVGEKCYEYYKNDKIYEKAKEEKEELKATNSIDWITIPNTNIDYPIAWKEGNNSYYLGHDIYGNESISGSIFYDGTKEPFQTHVTTIYGHSMRDGSMFNNLHYFRKSEDKFLTSKLVIERADGIVQNYKPLGVYVTNENFFYTDLYNMTLDESVQMIQEYSKYDIDVTYNEDAKIISLMTCSYENEGDRLFVFYISE